MKIKFVLIVRKLLIFGLYALQINLSLATHTEYSKNSLLPGNSVIVSPLEPNLYKRSQPEQLWTPEEEQLLLELRAQQSLPWTEIIDRFPKRSFSALQGKYYRMTRDPNKIKRKNKRWTSEEKKLLIKLVERDATWDEITEFFPGRTKKQIKARYFSLKGNYGVPNRFRGIWTAEEDELLLKLGKTGMPWEETATHFNNRSLSALKKKFNSLTAPSHNRYTPEEDNAIIEAVASGKTVAEISQLLGRSEAGLQVRIRKLKKSGRLDISTAPQILWGSHYTAIEYNVMEKMIKSGMSWEEIADRYFPARPSAKSMKEAFQRYQERQKKDD